MKDIDLKDLKAFAAVASARSFRGAAATGGVSASSLSEAVRRLETRLAVRLLNRTTRSVTPTEVGKRLLEGLVPAFSGISAALDAINSFRDSPRGSLRINAPTAVAQIVPPPIAIGFMKSHPGITLEIVANDSFVDVLAEGFDAGIRYEERLERDMIAIPIGPRTQRFAAGAAPIYLKERGRPQHPSDLLEHACIRHRFPSGVMPPWEFERDHKVVMVDPPGPLVASIIALELGAAIAGLGILCTFEEWLAPAFESGQLEPILTDWWPEFSGPYLYYASRKYMPAPLRAFIDYVKAAEKGTTANKDKGLRGSISG
jgi:DNA-binding transcriptional LysR family regulator